MQTERELKLHLEDRIMDIVKILLSGKDVEIRMTRDGITVAEIKRKLIRKQNAV